MEKAFLVGVNLYDGDDYLYNTKQLRTKIKYGNSVRALRIELEKLGKNIIK